MVETESAPEVGCVKWYNIKRGYGFFQRDGEVTPKDVFFHASDLHKCSIDDKLIEEGQRYRFSILGTPRGVKAVKISQDL